MKKFLSVLLCLTMVLSVVSMAGITANAYSFEELDTDRDMRVAFTFENDCQTKFIHNSSPSVWSVDKTHSLSYYPTSWVSGSVENNPVTGNTGVNGSVVNASGKAWFCCVQDRQSWRTQGGTVVHVLKEDGTTEPLVLENGVTYTVSLDYLVYKTHRTDDFTNLSGNTSHISVTEPDSGSIGYGYQLTSNSNYHPLTKPKTTLGTFYSYTEKANGADGKTYTGFSGTEQTGSWYHCSYTFTPTGMNELDFSSEGVTTAKDGDPFLIIFRNFAGGGGQTYIDNIVVTREVEATFNGMGGTPTASTVKGFVGDPITLPSAGRFGYEFDGWYEDGACTKLFTGNQFTAEMHYSPLYAGWSNQKIGFESYKPAADNGKALGSLFAVSAYRAFSGNRSMRYEYTANQLTDAKRTDASNLISLKPLERNQGYRVQFKYYIPSGKGGVTVYPVTMGTAYDSSSTYKAYSDKANTLTDIGVWRTCVLYFTSDFAGDGKNLALHVHATDNVDTVVYIDDVIVKESMGGRTLVVNAGPGLIDNQSEATVAMDFGSRLVFEDLHYDNHAVAGYYYDAAFTRPCNDQIFTEKLADSKLYVKWSELDDLEHYRFAKQEGALQNGFALSRVYAQSGVFSLALTSDGTAEEPGIAMVGEATNDTQYVISFRYYTTTPGTFTVGPATMNADFAKTVNTDYTKSTIQGGAREWKTAIIAFKAQITGSKGRLALAIQAPAGVASVLYVDDVTVTPLGSNERYVLFDTTAYGGDRTVSIGTVGSAIQFPNEPAAFGYRFDGWYTNKTFVTAFSEKNFSTSRVVYAKETAVTLSEVTGDVDGNGKIDTADLVRLKQYLAGYNVQVTETGADANGDGVINAMDLVRLYKKLAGLV